MSHRALWLKLKIIMPAVNETKTAIAEIPVATLSSTKTQIYKTQQRNLDHSRSSFRGGQWNNLKVKNVKRQKVSVFGKQISSF